MALIVGSKYDSKLLRDLVPPEYHDLRGQHYRMDVNVISDWLNKQPHLPPLTEDQVILFLHSCDNSLERAKEKIENYYTHRSNSPEIFGLRTGFEKELQDVLKVVRLAPLPQHCKSRQGHVLAIGALRDFNPQKFDFEKAVRANFIMVDLILARNPLLKGYQVIYDMTGLQFAHLGRLNFSIIKKTLAYVQQASPIRLRAAHVLNAAPLAHQLLEMFKPFMKKELADMIHLHTVADFDSFCQNYVAKEHLPHEFGGTLCSADQLNEDFFKAAVLAKDWLEDVGATKVDDTKRSSKTRKVNETLDMEGSFKKLELD